VNEAIDRHTPIGFYNLAEGEGHTFESCRVRHSLSKKSRRSWRRHRRSDERTAFSNAFKAGLTAARRGVQDDD
jgi:hypothetical protein